MAESQSSLFGTPNATWTPGTPATRFFRRVDGKVVAQDVILNYSEPEYPAIAIPQILDGKTVFVAREHARQVADATGAVY